VEDFCETVNKPSGSIKYWEILRSCATDGFSRRDQFHAISYKVYIYFSTVWPMSTNPMRQFLMNFIMYFIANILLIIVARRGKVTVPENFDKQISTLLEKKNNLISSQGLNNNWTGLHIFPGEISRNATTYKTWIQKRG
jgi:hypothetical protein